MTLRNWLMLGLVLGLGLCGCGMYPRRGVSPEQALVLEQGVMLRSTQFSPEQEARVLAIDPEQVTGAEVREILAEMPAPQLLLIHGGIQTVIRKMVSFADFLIGMGYPGQSISNAADGTYTYSCYESSRMMAGTIAWYYEKTGLRPILVGHSQGAMQAIKVLYHLAGPPTHEIAVWNPFTWEAEPHTTITDPLSGEVRPVVGLQIPYATGVGAGGVTRFLPNQWVMCGRLRTIPDSVEDYTSFYKRMDIWGSDCLGYGPLNLSKAAGTAVVRNVLLPTSYWHGRIPDTRHLLQDQAIIDWLNAYDPTNPTAPSELEFEADSRHILWAADVWHSLKKYWVLELQRLIRARRAQSHAH